METDDSGICLMGANGNRMCLSSKQFANLRYKVMNVYKLDHEPDVFEIKKLLNIKSPVEIIHKVINFMQDSNLEVNYKVQVPRIDDYGLSGLSVITVCKKLMHFYPNFHYRGPCLLDYENSPNYDYSNLRKYPLFKSGDNSYDMYYILLLNIPLSYFRSGHWIGLFVLKDAIFYYDSLNEDIKEEFQMLINTILLNLKLGENRIKMWRNTKQTQFSGKYCGVFQIHFLCIIIFLYNRGQLFKSNGDINVNKLNFYLQDNLRQETIESTIAKHFFI